MPGYGYGINYEYGLFKQQIESGYQKEQPDCWGSFGSPLLLHHPYDACLIPLYGRVEAPVYAGRDTQMAAGSTGKRCMACRMTCPLPAMGVGR